MGITRLIVIMVALFLAGPLWAKGNLADIHREILQKAEIQQLEVREENGKIVLEGRTFLLKEKSQAGAIARKESQKDVVNNISVMVPENKTDEEITLEVADRIRQKTARSTVFDALWIDTRYGVVRLEGRVRNAYLLDEAEKAAMEVRGVQAVENKIEILPPSQADDRLSIAIYNRLRHDDRLFYYFLGARPSIGILVKNGRVTLMGTVDTEGDKTIAGSLVRQMSGVLSVNNFLKVD